MGLVADQPKVFSLVPFARGREPSFFSRMMPSSAMSVHSSEASLMDSSLMLPETSGFRAMFTMENMGPLRIMLTTMIRTSANAIQVVPRANLRAGFSFLPTTRLATMASTSATPRMISSVCMERSTGMMSSGLKDSVRNIFLPPCFGCLHNSERTPNCTSCLL